MAGAETVFKQRRMLKGKQAGIIINDVLTVLEEEAQKPFWAEYKNAKGKVVCGWQALELQQHLGT